MVHFDRFRAYYYFRHPDSTRAAMARSTIVLVSLFCSCTVGYAQDWAELDALRFTPHPMPVHGAPADVVAPPAGGARARPGEGRAAAASGEPSPGLADEAAAQRSAIEARLEAIDEAQSADGVRAAALVDELTALAALYQEFGDHALAMEILDRALHVRRANAGLHSLEQVGIVEQLIASSRARGEYREYAALERRVAELANRNLDDPRAAHVLSAAADRQMDAFYDLLHDDAPPEITLSITGRGWRASNERYTALAALRGARRHYHSALNAAVAHERYDVVDLLRLQERIVDAYYLELAHADESPFGYLRYGDALGVLEARATNALRFETPEAAGRAFMEIGDWHLLGSRNGRALEIYRTAYELLKDAGLGDEVITGVMSFGVPRVLPVLSPERRDGRPTQEYRGYVDVSFEVTKYGVSKGVDVLGRSPGTSDDVARRLKRHIASNRFRPAFDNGRAIDSGPVAVRYYFAY